MTTEQIEAKIPALLDALRTVPLSPELDEVRTQLHLHAERRILLPQGLDPELTYGELGFEFHPVTVIGEPMSETVIRGRGEY